MTLLTEPGDYFFDRSVPRWAGKMVGFNVGSDMHGIGEAPNHLLKDVTVCVCVCV
jgi:hypothetical protein